MGLFSFSHKKNKKTKNENFKSIRLIEKYYSNTYGLSIPESESFKVMDSYIKEGEYFTTNQTLFLFRAETHGSGIIRFKLPFSGKMEKIHFNDNTYLSIGDRLINVLPIDDKTIIDSNIIKQKKPILDDTEISLIIDDFTNDKTISFNRIASLDTKYIKIYLHQENIASLNIGLTFINYNGYSYLSFLSLIDDFPIIKGDTIIMLFENDKKIEITFNNVAKGTIGHKTNSYPLSSEILEIFLLNKFNKAKIINPRKGLYGILTMDHNIEKEELQSFNAQYDRKIEGQYILQLMASKFIEMNLQQKI